jgi:serine/threonine protein kinase/tetratricopeptide (TPR) repeat protein
MSDWQRVQTLFLASVDLPTEERSRFLEEVCADDDELLKEIESLLATDADSGELIETVVREEASTLFDAQVLIGERLGIYRIVREIGRGGMGSVYLAWRDDEEFHKEVALKIVKRGMDTADVLERFRYERQILANLEHPYIARLFDGGSTHDGVPFFVMEYIQGVPVDVFCRENELDIQARCELFVRILEAVAYAHRNLVVHRDLKPANILITADGTPKLLDFGVAKLLSGDGEAEQTRAAVIRPYTPGYASPEQVRGLPITTSSDIYSLGAILYEMLIGKRAQPIDVQTPAEIERVVCETQVARPSLQARGLSPDLDNIVLMAMRKEPERRYQSVVQFGEDVRRYLDGRPVIARPSSLTYSLGKFVMRNRLPVAAASVAGFALVAGLVISLAQTQRAEASQRATEAQREIAVRQTSLAQAAGLETAKQRDLADGERVLADQQRDEAQVQRALADKRVKEILQLANTTLFQVHDAIAKLPGSIAARRTLVKATLEYLESLQREVGLDDEMREALCVAYYKIALIQGDAQGASGQDFQAAETNLLKAQTLLMPAYNRRPNSPDMMLRLIEVRATLADLMYRSGRREQALQEWLNLIPVAHRLSLVPDCPLECQTQEAVIENDLTYELLAYNPPEALEHANRGIALQRELLAKHPDDPSLKGALGSLTAAAAGAYRGLGDLEKSAEFYRQSINAREELMRLDANDSALQRNLLIAYGNYAMLLGVPWSANLDRPDEARTYAAKGVGLARAMVAADPDNATARHDLGMILGRMGMIDPSAGETAGSLQTLGEAAGLIEPILKANPKSAETANQLALIAEYQGRRQQALGRTTEAIASYRRAMAILQPFFDAKNASAFVEYAVNQMSLAKAYAASGDSDNALRLAKDAVTETEGYVAAAPGTDIHLANMAEAWSNLAAVQARTGHADEARQSAATARKLWSSIKQHGVLTAHREALGDVAAILDGTAAQ